MAEVQITSSNRRHSTLTLLALTIVALFVGLGIHLRDGEYLPTGRIFSPPIFSIGVAQLASLAAIFLRPRPVTHDRKEDFALAGLATALVAQFALLLLGPPSGWNSWSNDLRDESVENLRVYYVGLTAAAVLTLVLLLVRKRAWGFPFVALLGIHVILGVWLIRSAPAPHIDVWHFQQIGGEALANGENPYRWWKPDGSPRFPDIYADTAQAADRSVYGSSMTGGSDDDGAGHWLNFGFPYPPISLFVSTAAWLLVGDHRYAQLACLTLAGLMIALVKPTSWKTAAAALLLLFTPRAFFILGRGWSEPIVVFFLAATILCATRCRPLLPIALGLLLASKQYLVFAVPLAWLLVPNPRDWKAAVRLIGGALLVAAVVTLPMALWDLPAFVRSAFTVQAEAPFRTDALSWLAFAYHNWNVQPPAWIGFAAAIITLSLALRFCPRTPAGFCTGFAVVYLWFIAFNKQGFANYYLFVIAAAAGAVACCGSASADAEPAKRSTSDGQPDATKTPPSPTSAHVSS